MNTDCGPAVPSARTSWWTPTPCVASPGCRGWALAPRWSRSGPVSVRSPWPWSRRGPTSPRWRSTAVSSAPARPGRTARRAGRRGRRAARSTGPVLVGGDAGGPPAWAMVANLPYNVAVPVVIGALDEAPERRVDAGDGAARGGRAAGRGTRRQGLRRGLGEGGVSRHRHGGRPGSCLGVRAHAPGGVGAGPHRAAPDRGRGDPGVVPASRLFELVRAGFGHRRKMLRQSLAGVVPSEAFAARPGSTPRRGPRTSACRSGGRLAASRRLPRGGSRSERCRTTPVPRAVLSVGPSGTSRRAAGAERAAAPDALGPAKLTLSLSVTGVREDGFHLLDAEMVSIDLADTLSFEPGTGITVVDEVVGDVGAGRPRHRAREPRRAQALDLAVGRTCRRPRRQAHPGRVPVSEAVRPTPAPCCAGPAALTPCSPLSSVPTCRSVSAGDGPG